MFLGTAVLACAVFTAVSCQELNTFDPEYGVFIGELPNLADGDIKGKVYVVNDSTFQVVNFTYNGNAPDLYFWLERKSSPLSEGLKIPTFEYGITPLGAYDNVKRVVLNIPAHSKINDFKSFALFCSQYEHNFASLPIPENLNAPKPQFLGSELKGNRYNIASGPILIVDRRTIKVFGFTFDADLAPDSYFFVGRGPNVAHDAGVKVPIRGRDSASSVKAMDKKYRGGEDILLELPEDYDIEHIDWLSIYCYKFRVDFNHVAVSNISHRIPPFIPPQKKFDEIVSNVNGWKTVSLLGTDSRKNFTFQLGVPGGSKGYQSMTRARPAKYVWYVNGVLADIYLKRHVTYTFIVEGGNDKSSTDFYNPLYLSDDQFGGYRKLTNEERTYVHVLSGMEPSTYAGRLCVWANDANADPENVNSFSEFRKNLRLKCEADKTPAVFKFTPEETTPDTIYFQSYSSYNMGWKIHIVDQLPTDVDDVVEEPYVYEQWLQTQTTHGEINSVGVISTTVALLSALLFL